ncbi:MAG: EFR1 family ferrodoxin [Coriobacteriales bacterium]|jgi:ferredoxin|nr:EFR1 family ferrodoxin [Coriobacteriales bacterium]
MAAETPAAAGRAPAPDRTAALYFSGMGNTKYAVNRLAQSLGVKDENILSIEDNEGRVRERLVHADTVLVAHPNYMCLMPKIMSDYLAQHGTWLANKDLITLVTYANFFFDADLQVARLLRKQGIPFRAQSNISIQMPMVVCDMKLMQPTDTDTQRTLKEKADSRLDEFAQIILAGDAVHDGQESDRLKAFLRQRMFYQGRIQRDFAKLNISKACTRCGACVRACPKQNLEIREDEIRQLGRCTQCYRCANLCPRQAITLWGKRVQWQYKGI